MEIKDYVNDLLSDEHLSDKELEAWLVEMKVIDAEQFGQSIKNSLIKFISTLKNWMPKLW